jgi:hypothetical protein
MAKTIKLMLREIIVPEHAWKVTILNNWESVIGELKTKVFIEVILDEQVILGVTHPALAQELLFLSPLIKQKINALFTQERIKKIGFRVIQKRPIGSECFIEQRNYDNCLKKEISSIYPLTIRQHEVLALLKDPDLKASCEKFFKRCLQQGDHNERKKSIK